MTQFQIFKRAFGVISLSMFLSSPFWVAPAAAQTDNNPPVVPDVQGPASSGNPSKIPDPRDIQSNYPAPPPRRNRNLTPLHNIRGPNGPLPPGEVPGATSPAVGGERSAPGNSGVRMARPSNGGPVYSPTNPASPAAHAGVGPKVSYQNGARTIKVNEGIREITIVDHPTTGIYVEIIKQYGPDEMQALKRNLPGITDYIEMFPTEINTTEISLSIGVKSKYTALTPDQLRSENPGAYNVYRRYTQTVDQQQRRQDHPEDSSRGSRLIK